MLSTLRHYLQRQGSASLADVARYLGVTPDVARQMLEVWMRKGLVTRQFATTSCGSQCQQCDMATVEIYTWKDSIVTTEPPTCPNTDLDFNS